MNNSNIANILKHVCISVQKNDGDLVSLYNATKTSSKNREYFCIECKEQAMLKEGQIKIRHFSHYPGSSCTFFERKGESMMHLKMKEVVKLYLEKGGYISVIQNECQKHPKQINLEDGDKVVLEYISPDRTWIADICIVDSSNTPKKIIEIYHSHKTEVDRPYDWVELSTRDIGRFCDEQFNLNDMKNIRISDYHKSQYQSSPIPFQITKRYIIYNDGKKVKNHYKTTTFDMFKRYSFYRREDFSHCFKRAIENYEYEYISYISILMSLVYIEVDEMREIVRLGGYSLECDECCEIVYDRLISRNEKNKEYKIMKDKEEFDKKQKELEERVDKDRLYKEEMEKYRLHKIKMKELEDKNKHIEEVKSYLDRQLKYKTFFMDGGIMSDVKKCNEGHVSIVPIKFDRDTMHIIINAHLAEFDKSIDGFEIDPYIIIYDTLTNSFFNRIFLDDIYVDNGQCFVKYPICKEECTECIKLDKKEQFLKKLPERFKEIKKELKLNEIEIEKISKSENPDFNKIRELRKQTSDITLEKNKIIKNIKRNM